jgi:hypothetical protein
LPRGVETKEPVAMQLFQRVPVLAALALTSALSGCAGPTFVVQQYPGAVRPKESIAILRVNGNEPVRLATLDDEDLAGEPIASDSRLHIEMLPGKHVVTVLNANAPQEPGAPLAFEAQAGKVYRVTFVTGAARVYEVDRGADTAMSDVTQQARQ